LISALLVSLLFLASIHLRGVKPYGIICHVTLTIYSRSWLILEDFNAIMNAFDKYIGGLHGMKT
jgi:hypothetical protein